MWRWCRRQKSAAISPVAKHFKGITIHCGAESYQCNVILFGLVWARPRAHAFIESRAQKIWTTMGNTLTTVMHFKRNGVMHCGWFTIHCHGYVKKNVISTIEQRTTAMSMAISFASNYSKRMRTACAIETIPHFDSVEPMKKKAESSFVLQNILSLALPWPGEANDFRQYKTVRTWHFRAIFAYLSQLWLPLLQM